MKTKILAIVTILLVASGLYAQELKSGMDQFGSWENRMDTTRDEARHFYTFRLGVVTRRDSDGRAKVIYGVMGRTANYEITVQPVNAASISDAAETHSAGDPRQSMIEADATTPRVSYYIPGKYSLDLDPSANALLVTLKPIAGKGQGRETAVLKAVFHLDKNEWFFEERVFEVPVSPIW